MDATPNEQWLPIPGFKGYEVSDLGRVRSLPRVVHFPPTCQNQTRRFYPGRLIKQREGRSGYLEANLSLNGKVHQKSVHCLVALAFIGPRPDGWVTRHLNDQRHDNKLANIRYGSQSDNIADCVTNGNHRCARVTHCPEGHEYNSTNTYVRPRGSRECRLCRAASKARFDASRKQT